MDVVDLHPVSRTRIGRHPIGARQTDLHQTVREECAESSGGLDLDRGVVILPKAEIRDPQPEASEFGIGKGEADSIRHSRMALDHQFGSLDSQHEGLPFGRHGRFLSVDGALDGTQDVRQKRTSDRGDLPAFLLAVTPSAWKNLAAPRADLPEVSGSLHGVRTVHGVGLTLCQLEGQRILTLPRRGRHATQGPIRHNPQDVEDLLQRFPITGPLHPIGSITSTNMAQAPTTLAYLFTDIESSTKLWERHPASMPEALRRHDQILRAAVATSGGELVKSTGDGIMAAFGDPTAAITAASTAQLEIEREEWAQADPIRVRMGIHYGTSTPRDGDYYGTEVNKAARVMSVGHGGQILITQAVLDASVQGLPGELSARNLGTHRLKDLGSPVVLYQLAGSGLPDVFEPLNTLDVRPNNLISQPSTFFGRDTELADIGALIDDPGTRLVTLTGPGGTGKTRLALQVAAGRIDRFDEGAFFVDLSATSEPTAAYRAVIETLGLETGADDDLLDSLVAGLGNASMLLILDNFEQVTSAATGVAALLAACPSVEMVITSREPLHVRGEHVYPVPPLPLPDPSEGSVEQIGAADAVQLFVERARSAHPSFELTTDNAAAVASICRRLDGLPLALELAAARLRLFSAEDLDRKLEARLDILGSGARDLPTRQQTLRSTVEWSVDLLHDAERQLYAVMSVFAGAALDAVEAVLGQLTDLAIDPYDGVAALVDKSLIRREDGPGGSVRFRMLETLREYAAELLDGDTFLAGSAPAAHAEAYRRTAIGALPELSGSRRDQTLDALTSDLGNYRLAWRYYLARSEYQKLSDLLGTLWTLYDRRGWYDGLADLVDDMLSVLADEPDTPERRREEIALQMSAARAIMTVRGYTPDVEERFDHALALADQAGALPQKFPVLRSLASLHFQRGEPIKGEVVGRELVSVAEAQDDPALRSEAYYVLGSNLVMLNQFDEGMALLDRALQLFDPSVAQADTYRIGPSPGVVTLTTTAFMRFFFGEAETAWRCAERALEVAHRIEHPHSLVYALYHVALLALWRQDLAEASLRSDELRAAADAQDYAVWRSLAMVMQGVCQIAFGDPDQGIPTMEEGAAIYATLKTPPGFMSGVFMLRCMGHLMAGKADRALELMNESMAFNVAAAAVNQLDSTPFSAMAMVTLGDIHASLPQPDRAEVVGLYEQAKSQAVELGLLGVELQAVSRLFQAHRGGPGESAAREELQSAYNRLTEGYDEPLAIAVRELLSQ